MTFRSFSLVLILVAVVFGLAGCLSSSDPSFCGPMGGCNANPNYSPPASSPAVQASGGPRDWWWSVNPCSLVTAADLRMMGFPTTAGYPIMHSPPSSTTPAENICLWDSAKNNLGITLTNVPYTYWGANTVPGDIAFRTADGRPGTIFPQLAAAGSCHVAVQATQSSSAVVNVDRSPASDACPVAVKVANLLAAELPPASQG